jgi:hypothetical protein
LLSLLTNYHKNSLINKKFSRQDFAKEVLSLYYSEIPRKYKSMTNLINMWATEVFCEVTNDVIFEYYENNFDISVKKEIDIKNFSKSKVNNWD